MIERTKTHIGRYVAPLALVSRFRNATALSPGWDQPRLVRQAGGRRP